MEKFRGLPAQRRVIELLLRRNLSVNDGESLFSGGLFEDLTLEVVYRADEINRRRKAKINRINGDDSLRSNEKKNID